MNIITKKTMKGNYFHQNIKITKLEYINLFTKQHQLYYNVIKGKVNRQ